MLDVGCGRGAFLKTAAQAGLDCYGIELNNSAVEFALSEGRRVSAELVGDHAVRFPEILRRSLFISSLGAHC